MIVFETLKSKNGKKITEDLDEFVVNITNYFKEKSIVDS